MPKALRRENLLFVPAILGAVTETAVLLAAGPKDSAGLGPQVSAPPPFDLFHDLRWISVYHLSWWMLGLELGAVLVLRSLYMAWFVQRAWPNHDRPPMPIAFVRVLTFYAVAALLLLPWVALLFALAVSKISYFFFVAVPPALLLALLIHRGAMTHAAGQWWRWTPTLRSVGWLGAAFAWLTVSGGIVSETPLAVGLLAAAGAGALNALADRSIVRRIALAPAPARRTHRVLVPALVTVVFGVAIGGTAAGLAKTGRPSNDRTTISIPRAASGHPVLVVAGFDSRWSHPTLDLPDGFFAWRYSYRGLDAERRPIPYGPQDTHQSLLDSARAMDEQVRALRGAYGEPVTIVAESEGALVARVYLLKLYQDGSRAVDRLVVLDMPSGRPVVYYPPRGAQGWGVGSGWALRGLAAVVRALGPLQVSADAPVLRDLVDCRTLALEVATAPAPAGVVQVTVRALADVVDGAAPRGLPSADTYVVTATHGGLVNERAVQGVIGAVLLGTPRRAEGVGLEALRAVSAFSSAWRVPRLADGLAPNVDC